MIYEDEELTITAFATGDYQIGSKNQRYQRSGYGFLLITPPAMRRLCNALQERIW